MQEIVDTPLGRVRVDTTGTRVNEVHLGASGPGAAPRSPLGRDVVRHLSGKFVDFRRYEVDLDAFSTFERAVFEATREIRRGEVRSYGHVASAIGKPAASRAVGNALGKNPACLVIPCHRVVAVDGLGGFTSGLRWKRALLDLEGGIP